MGSIDEGTLLRAGGDWAGYGELSGPAFLQLLQQDKIRVQFAGDSLLVWVQRPDGLAGVYKLVHTQDSPPPPVLPFTNETVALAANAPLKNVQNNWPLIYKTMNLPQYNLGTPLNCVGVVGTIAKETGAFLPVREAYYIYDQDPAIAEQMYQKDKTPAYAWYNDTVAHAPYEGGPEYHGRGYVQLTHKGNYQKVQDKTGLPVVAEPDLLLKPEPAAHALCIYWQDRGIAAMCERRDWNAVRTAVYGGNDPDGVARLQRAERIMIG